MRLLINRLKGLINMELTIGQKFYCVCEYKITELYPEQNIVLAQNVDLNKSTIWSFQQVEKILTVNDSIDNEIDMALGHAE
jgi:hypothetical protein